MSQKILPGGHFLEMFMPYRSDEAKMIQVLERACGIWILQECRTGDLL
ncbi:MAG: hypothetical protein V8S96_02100 [Lachnospiraceae bacterium]